jgi:hypothetical protein
VTSGGASTPVPNEPPSLLPQPDAPDFVTQAGTTFGWTKGEFTVSKFKWTGGVTVLARWPISDDGWKQAWDYMRAQHPDLANQVLDACARRRDDQGAASDREVLASEHPLRILRGWVLAGGQGWEPGIAAGESVDVYFTEQGMTMTRAGNFRAYLKRDYGSINSLEIHAGTGGDAPSGAMRSYSPSSPSASS